MKRIKNRDLNSDSKNAPLNYFYKYQPVKDKDRRSIHNLFDCKAVFSSRLNFNDPFDCKIPIKEPTPNEAYYFLREHQEFRHIVTCIDRISLLHMARENANKMIDKYRFYCLSKDSRNILMWSYYADGHEGFCIEFKSSHLQPQKVTYVTNLPALKLTNLLGKTEQELKNGADIIWKALRMKLIEWKHENEYRLPSW
jgi:hypothetical protein